MWMDTYGLLPGSAILCGDCILVMTDPGECAFHDDWTPALLDNQNSFFLPHRPRLVSRQALPFVPGLPSLTV